MQKKLSVIILNWNGTKDTIDCLESLKINKCNYDIYLLDNASNQEQVQELKSYINDSGYVYSILSIGEFNGNLNKAHNELNLILSTFNYGFAIGNNIIAEKICNEYEYILLLNNDTIVPENSLLSMLNKMEKYNPIALTCDIRYNYNRSKLWNAGGKLKWYGDRKYYSQKKIDNFICKGKNYINAEFITGCALLINSKFIQNYKLFTDKFFHGEEDFNFCYYAKKMKLKLGVDLDAKIFHKVGQSINRVESQSQKLKSLTVHYTNRVIDFKNIYSKFHWILWRRFYLFLIGIKRKISGMTKSKIKLVKKKIVFYSNKYNDVKYNVFNEIMNDNELM